MKLFPLLLELFSNHGVIFLYFILEVLSIPQGLLYFFLQTLLILNPFAAISNKFFGKFFNLINFLLELLDGFALYFDHLFKVITLENEIRYRLFVMSFIPSANFYQNVQPFMLKQRIGILILYLLDLLFNLSNLFLSLLDFLLILQLTLVVVLNYLELFQSLR